MLCLCTSIYENNKYKGVTIMGFTWGDEDKKYLEIQKKAVAKCIAVEQKYKKYGFATPTFSFPNDEFSLELPLAERRTNNRRY